MNIEQLSYLILKECIKKERRQGEVMSVLSSHGIELSDLDAREIGRYIHLKGLGQVIPASRGRVLVIANMNAVNFVNKTNNMTFEEKLKLIYSELENLPNKKGNLEEILDRLGIEHDVYSEREFAEEFKINGYVRVTAESKDGYEILLTQKGQDFLHNPPEPQRQPSIFITENYTNSNVNKGGVQSGTFGAGNSAVNSHNASPSPVFDDPILQNYYEDLETKFTTNDADADTAPFSQKLQGLLFGVYDEIKKLVEVEKDDENFEEAERILKEIKSAQKNIGKSTKRQALKTMQKIVAMCQKYSYHIGRVILDGSIFEVAKYLATGSM